MIQSGSAPFYYSLKKTEVPSFLLNKESTVIKINITNNFILIYSTEFSELVIYIFSGALAMTE